MGQVQGSAFCRNCKTQVMTVRNTPSHLLHLILSIVTAGLWLFVWFFIIINGSGPARCTRCGLDTARPFIFRLARFGVIALSAFIAIIVLGAVVGGSGSGGSATNTARNSATSGNSFTKSIDQAIEKQAHPKPAPTPAPASASAKTSPKTNLRIKYDENPVITTAYDISHYFLNNKNNLPSLYFGKWVYFTGKLKSIDIDKQGYYFIIISEPGQPIDIKCEITNKDADKLVKLKPGDEITIVGNVAGLYDQIDILRCTIQSR